MGQFRVSVEVANPADGRFTPVEPLVDTGATFTVLPAAFLRQLGLSPHKEEDFTLADGGVRKWGVGEARFRINGEELNSPVIFGDEGVSLLGAVTLEIFALIADTTNKRLVHPPELLLVGIRGPGSGAG